MADFSITGVTKLDNSGFSTGISKMASTGLKVLGVGLAAASTGIAAFGAYSIKTGQEFDTAMSQVAATMGTTVDQIDELTSLAKEMGATTKFTATEAAEGLNYLALAGYTTDQQIAALPTVLNLAAAGSMELATASDLVTDAMSAMGMEATQENLEKYADQMAKAASNSNTSVQQLGEATLVCGGQAKLCGMDLTDMNSALGILADNGIKGSEGGTALRNVLKNLYTPTSAAQKAIDKLGISTSNADGSLRETQDVLQDLSGALGNLSEADRIKAMNDIFDTRTIAAANALLKDSGDRWDELAVTIEDSAGACEQMAATQLDNLEGDVTLLQSAFSGFALSVYDQMKPALREFVQFGTDAVGQLQQGFESGGIDGLMSALGNVIGDLVSKAATYAPKMVELAVALLKALAQAIVDNAPLILESIRQVIDTVLDGISDLIPGLSPITDAIKWIVDNIETLLPFIAALGAAMVAIKAVNMVSGIIELVSGMGGLISMVQTAGSAIAALAGGPIGIIIAVIAAVVAALVVLYNTNEDFRNAVNSLWEQIKDIFASVLEILQPVIDSVMQAFQSIVEWVQQAWTAAQPFLEAAMQFIFDTISAVIESLKPIIKAIATAFVSAWQMIQSIWAFVQPYFAAIWAGIKAVFAVVAPVMGQFFASAWQVIQAVWSVVTGYFSAIWNTIAGIFSVVSAVFSGDFSGAWAAIQGIVGQWAGFFGTVWSAITSIFSAVASFFGSIFSAAWQAICSAFSAVGSFFSGIISQITGLFTSLPSKFMSIGSSIIDGLWSGIQSGWSWLTGKVSSLATGLLDAAKGALGIHSPSKKFAWVGKMSAVGMEHGFENENPVGNIQDSVAAQMKKLNTSFSFGAGTPVGAGNAVVDNSTHVTFNQPVKTPSETARAIYRQRTAGLAGARA